MRWGRLAAMALVVVGLGLLASMCSKSSSQAPDRPDLLPQAQSAR